MNPIDIAPILVAVVAALGAWAAQRSASKTSKSNLATSGRLEAEHGAYQRARTFDVQTIERQHDEIVSLQDANERLRREVIVLQKRVARLEALNPDFERLLDEERYEPPGNH